DGYGMMNGAELVLQDRAGKSPVELKAMSDSVIAQIMKQPGVQFAYTMFRADYPQMELEVDEDKAAQLGVDVSEMLSSVQTYFAGDQSLNFNRFGKFYRIAVKADGIYRTDKEAFNEIFVKNNLGQMVPVNTLVTLRKVYGPESVTRYNLYNSLTINVVSTPGISNGAIMETLEKNVLTKLPGDYSYEWTGLSLEEKSSGNQTVLILALSLLFVYFLLSAQYESYLLPLAVLLSIPTGMIGSFLGTRAIGLDNNIYVQVGLIMLIGLLAKNAILIVEFALQRRRAGSSLIDSALEGARARLRPILMTSMAFIAGMVPLMFATGGTATGNHSISTGAAMGMLSGVILGVIIIPLLYLVFQYLQEKVSGKKLTDNTVHNTND
ncbi:efflux RND transporter permease subunit, partial [Sphingobacterium sp.]|uniref:efflux RND transporter permease subunit n=1 Tax=Sphingobacterium sp. TaxID=341027 RepID=UPI0028969954